MIMLASTFLTVTCATAKPADPTTVTVPTVAKPADVTTTHEGSTDQKYSPFVTEILAEYERRQEIRTEFLAAACWLANETDDSEARAVCDLLKANIVTLIPIRSKLITFDPSKKDQPIVLLVITGNELEGFPDLNAMDKKMNGVGYLIAYPSHPSPLMMLKYDKEMSKLRLALVILHEGKHALDYFSQPSNAPEQTELERALDEEHAYEFEVRLLDKLCGEKYRTLIQAQVVRHRQAGSELPEDIRVERDRKLDEALDDIFRTLDPKRHDRKYLRNRFDLEVWTRYLEEEFPDDGVADKLKATLYLRQKNIKKEKEK